MSDGYDTDTCDGCGFERELGKAKLCSDCESFADGAKSAKAHAEAEAASLRQRIEELERTLRDSRAMAEKIGANLQRQLTAAESEREALRLVLARGGCQDNARPVLAPKQTCNERGLSEPCWVCRALARNPEGPKSGRVEE